jgi:hypothetical protein
MISIAPLKYLLYFKSYFKAHQAIVNTGLIEFGGVDFSFLNLISKKDCIFATQPNFGGAKY